jgi:hypothetical protein
MSETEAPQAEGNWVTRQVEERTGKPIREVLTLVILSATAVLTAWCGFESSKWGGEMSIAFSQASSARIQAAGAQAEANSNRQFDLTVYASYVNAVATEQPKLVAYIEQRFTPRFATAFEDWNAHDRALPSPFAEPSYVPEGSKEAEALSQRADTKFAAALENNARGDRYSLLTVLFALVLFFAAMSGRDFAAWVSRAFLTIAGVLMVVGIAVLSTFPIIV